MERPWTLDGGSVEGAPGGTKREDRLMLGFANDNLDAAAPNQQTPAAAGAVTLAYGNRDSRCFGGGRRGAIAPYGAAHARAFDAGSDPLAAAPCCRFRRRSSPGGRGRWACRRSGRFAPRLDGPCRCADGAGDEHRRRRGLPGAWHRAAAGRGERRASASLGLRPDRTHQPARALRSSFVLRNGGFRPYLETLLDAGLVPAAARL